MHREGLLEKLATTLDWSVPERNGLGFASGEGCRRDCQTSLQRNGMFPMTASVWKPGEHVFGGILSPDITPTIKVQVRTLGYRVTLRNVKAQLPPGESNGAE